MGRPDRTPSAVPVSPASASGRSSSTGATSRCSPTRPTATWRPPSIRPSSTASRGTRRRDMAPAASPRTTTAPTTQPPHDKK